RLAPRRIGLRARAVLGPARLVLRPEAVHGEAEIAAGIALALARVPLRRAPARRPGEREQIVVEGPFGSRRGHGDEAEAERKPLYHRVHPHYISGQFPRENRPSRPPETRGAPEFSAAGEACSKG